MTMNGSSENIEHDPIRIYSISRMESTGNCALLWETDTEASIVRFFQMGAHARDDLTDNKLSTSRRMLKLQNKWWLSLYNDRFELHRVVTGPSFVWFIAWLRQTDAKFLHTEWALTTTLANPTII